MVRAEDYTGREQAYVKHFVLDHYLEQLAFKVGQFRNNTTLNYIDGFSGPWQHATEDLRDTSPHIALAKLRTAKDQLDARRFNLRIRGFFVEENADAHRLLTEVLDRDFSDIETIAIPGRFEKSIDQATRFAQSGPNPFAFIFIDPTGWTGYGLRAITPLIRVKPCEVMINFMTKDIIRFIDDEESVALQSFTDLFGDPKYRTAWSGLAGLDREDAIIAAYCNRLRAAGNFQHVVATIVLNPQQDRTHYHLVYATRSLHGLAAFRETEARATDRQYEVRAEARQRNRVESRSQFELFPASTMETQYINEIRERYQSQAKHSTERLLRQERQVMFDDLVAHALSFPLTRLATLKAWLEEWRKGGRLQYTGLLQTQRTPSMRKDHAVQWSDPPLRGS